jgi:TonB-linked outer membrane protein, SusC/RagA family
MIKDVLLEIKKQTDYSFLYNNNELDENIQVTLNMDNATIDKVLDIALKNQDLKYEVENNVIVIYKPRTANERDMNRDLSQNRRKITGKVTDSSTHEPLIGVSISITGASGGTITDQDGNFSIDVPEGVTLHISYIGFASQSIKIGNQTHLNIVMQEDSKVLSEVVIVGFGTQKKINLTGAVAAIDSKVFEERPVSSAVQALQGAVSGLNIFNSGNGGELNAAKEINVRGTGTIGSESKGNPLILIDGMEGDINTINPQDIENISVLKDASASAIYGSRAPFGVILVTTKMGKKGRPVVNYNNNFRFNTPIMLPEMANSWEFVNYFNDGNFNNAGSYVYDAAHLQDIKDYIDGKKDPNDTMPINATSGKWNTGKAYANVDWMQEYYKDWSSSQEHNISISGGGDNMTYYLSANYQGQDGFLRYGTDKHRRYTITGKISAKLTDYLKVDYSNRFGRTDYDRPTQMSSNVYSEILRRSTPIIPVKDPNGYYVSDSHFIENFVNGGRHAEQKDDMSQQVKITLSPVTGWNIIGEMNFRTTNTWIDEASKMTYGHMAEDPEMTYRAYLSPTTDNVYGYAYRSTFLNPNIYTNYNRSFGIHNLGLTGGMQHENSKARLMSAKRNGIIVQDLPVLDLTSDNSVIDIKGNRNRWVTTGFFGRLNYDIDNRYLFEFNLRYDGTSRFRRDNRWVWTTSASVGWNVASEKFFEGLREYVEVLKPRVSYGELPNQNTTSLYPTYQTIPTSIGGGLWLLDGARPNTGASPKLVSTVLTWEKVSTLNIGVDWNAFRNRLTGSFDYFTRKTKDMVGPGVELPASLGAAVPNTNNTDLKTYGWELEIAWRDKINDFSYGAGINLSDAQTRITKYPNPTGLLSKYLEGELLGDIYGYTTIGIAKSDDEMNAHLAALPEGGQSVIGSNWRAGDIMYADINGDGKVSNGSNTIHDMGDLKKIGNTTPRYMFGINLNAAWKGIDLSMFWQGVLKRDFYPDANPSGASGDQNMVFWGITQSGRFYSTAFKEHLDYFRADEDHNLGQNLDAYYARPLFNTKNKVTQTKYLQNAAYMRLKNLQIGYTFPQQWTHKIKLERLRFYVSGENLLTFTNFTKTMDPETAGIGKKGGVVYPLSRTYSFGLSANF